MMKNWHQTEVPSGILVILLLLSAWGVTVGILALFIGLVRLSEYFL